MKQLVNLIEILLERKALDDEDIQHLVAFLLQHSEKQWYRYRCTNPGCGAKVFSSEELTECYCHGMPMERDE